MIESTGSGVGCTDFKIDRGYIFLVCNLHRRKIVGKRKTGGQSNSPDDYKVRLGPQGGCRAAIKEIGS